MRSKHSKRTLKPHWVKGLGLTLLVNMPNKMRHGQITASYLGFRVRPCQARFWFEVSEQPGCSLCFLHVLSSVSKDLALDYGSKLGTLRFSGLGSGFEVWSLRV